MYRNHIFVTGPPGCGKTTLIKNICEVLKNKQISCSGFYTEEIRENGFRCGFDVVTLNSNERFPLARIAENKHDKGACVGRYVVNVDSFEQSLKLIFENEKQYSKILIIDEIGKMESFSKYFIKIIRKYFKLDSGIIILASIPENRTKLFFIEQLCQLPSAEIFTINRENRNQLVKVLSDNILYMHSRLNK